MPDYLIALFCLIIGVPFAFAIISATMLSSQISQQEEKDHDNL